MANKAEKLGLPRDTDLYKVECDQCNDEDNLTADPKEAGDVVITTESAVDEETNSGILIEHKTLVTRWECTNCGATNTIEIQEDDQ